MEHVPKESGYLLAFAGFGLSLFLIGLGLPSEDGFVGLGLLGLLTQQGLNALCPFGLDACQVLSTAPVARRATKAVATASPTLCRRMNLRAR